jgi:hypothetical protein
MGEFCATVADFVLERCREPDGQASRLAGGGHILQCHMGCPGTRTAKAGGRFRDGAGRPRAGGRQPGRRCAFLSILTSGRSSPMPGWQGATRSHNDECMIRDVSIPAARIAGLVSFLSPCVLPLQNFG